MRRVCTPHASKEPSPTSSGSVEMCLRSGVGTQNVHPLSAPPRLPSLIYIQLLSHWSVSVSSCHIAVFLVLRKLAPSIGVDCARVHCMLRRRKCPPSNYTGPNLKMTKFPPPPARHIAQLVTRNNGSLCSFNSGSLYD
jgi:hypothetical protein